MKHGIRTIIADDEPAGRRTLQMLLEEDPDTDIVATCRSGKETTEAVLRQRPDLLFLDIEMPEGDGFETLESLPHDVKPVVVFVTAFDSYAVQAFGVQAADYLLKPFSDARFRAAHARAKERLWQQTRVATERATGLLRRMGGEATATPQLGTPDKRLAIPTSRGIRFVALDEIDLIEAQGDYVRIYTGDRFELVRGPIGRFEAQLSGSRFVRIHRSAVVHLDQLAEIQRCPTGELEAVLHSGRRCKVSQSGRERLGRAMGHQL
ncbi:MAG: LytTR family DNA-binding domain-containing protein [Gemmatimonadales bacterium]